MYAITFGFVPKWPKTIDIFFVGTTSGVISDDTLKEPKKGYIIGIIVMSYSCHRICGLAYSTTSQVNTSGPSMPVTMAHCLMTGTRSGSKRDQWRTMHFLRWC